MELIIVVIQGNSSSGFLTEQVLIFRSLHENNGRTKVRRSANFLTILQGNVRLIRP
jgi:hypothetical protein